VRRRFGQDVKIHEKFGRIENFAPPKAQDSHMPLVRTVYDDLLRRVAARSNQGRNDAGQGAQFPKRRKVLTMSQELQCSTNEIYKSFLLNSRGQGISGKNEQSI